MPILTHYQALSTHKPYTQTAVPEARLPAYKYVDGFDRGHMAVLRAHNGTRTTEADLEVFHAFQASAVSDRVSNCDYHWLEDLS